MLDLLQLKTFTLVAQKNSFTNAAVELGCSQSTVTFQIKALEKELGVKLFERHRFSRHIELTESGRSLYEQALELLASAEGVRDKVSAEKDRLPKPARRAAPSVGDNDGGGEPER